MWRTCGQVGYTTSFVSLVFLRTVMSSRWRRHRAWSVPWGCRTNNTLTTSFTAGRPPTEGGNFRAVDLVGSYGICCRRYHRPFFSSYRTRTSVSSRFDYLLLPGAARRSGTRLSHSLTIVLYTVLYRFIPISLTHSIAISLPRACAIMLRRSVKLVVTGYSLSSFHFLPPYYSVHGPGTAH